MGASRVFSGYDGMDLTIEIVQGDPCFVLYDLLAGDYPDTGGAMQASPRLLAVMAAATAALWAWAGL